MWRTIDKCRLTPLLWAAYPHHPGIVESNRTPNRQEILIGQPVINGLLSLFGASQVVALGNVAHMSLRALGIDAKKLGILQGVALAYSNVR